MNTDKIAALIERVENAKGADNALDIEVDLATFVPDAHYASVRPNAAGTKLIYTRHDGRNETVWAYDWTLNAEYRANAAALLRALLAKGE